MTLSSIDEIEIFNKLKADHTYRTDRLFIPLLIFEWIVCLAMAHIISPRVWSGAESQIHIHLIVAYIIGGGASLVPLFMILRKPGDIWNKYYVTISQFIFSVLFIHFTGGRIESHFFIFGSLAFVAIYQKYTPLVIFTVLVAVDHAVRGYFWSQSIYGVLAAAPWRSLEHAAWVVFEEIILFYSIFISDREKKIIASTQFQLKTTLSSVSSENEAYKLALDESAIVAITDVGGKILYANDNFCEISGYKKHELIGQNHRLVNSGLHDKTFFKNMFSIIASGKTWRGDICNKSKTGKLYWVDTAIVPEFDEDDKISRYFSVRFDISKKKEAESQLIQSSKMSSLGEMAGGIAHEINTPLSIIQMKAAMIIAQTENSEIEFKPEKINKDAKIIDETVNRISKIITSLRSFSRNSATMI